MGIEELKAMFPNYHPEDYIFSVASCCGSCRWGENKTAFILCHRGKVDLEMFPYGLCPQYERNTEKKYPVIMHSIKGIYGHGEG